MAKASTFSGFGKAPEAPAPKKGKTNDKKRVETPGTRNVASLRAMIAILTATLNDEMNTLKTGPMTDYFVAEGMTLKAQPDNYEAYEGAHTASMQLQKRSSASVLSEEEAALCTLYDLPIKTETVVVDALLFNPAYMEGGDKYDPAMVKKIETSLKKIGLPEDIIQRQAGVTKVVTTEETIPALFKLTDEAVVRQLMDVVTTLAVKPKYAIVNDDVTPIFQDVGAVLGLSKFAEIIKKAANDPDSVKSGDAKKSRSSKKAA